MVSPFNYSGAINTSIGPLHLAAGAVFRQICTYVREMARATDFSSFLLSRFLCSARLLSLLPFPRVARSAREASPRTQRLSRSVLRDYRVRWPDKTPGESGRLIEAAIVPTRQAEYDFLEILLVEKDVGHRGGRSKEKADDEMIKSSALIRRYCVYLRG